MPKSRKMSNKNNNKPNKKRVKRRVASQVTQHTPGIPLSHCAMKYALAIADPWNPQAEGACVPRHPSRPSHKVRGFLRTTVTIGTGGFGFAYACPSLANNAFSFFGSLANYEGTSIGGDTYISGGVTYNGIVPTGTGAAPSTPNATTTGAKYVAMADLPYVRSQLTSTSRTTPSEIGGRIVSCAMSWQYTGTVSDMGGLAYALVHPNHGNLNSGAQRIPQYAETQVVRIDNKRRWIGTSALDELELSYTQSQTAVDTPNTSPSPIYPYSNNEQLDLVNTTSGGAPMAIWFTGKPGNTFEVEMVCHYEYIGVPTTFSSTPTHSDSVGFEVVQNASARLPALIQSNPNATRPSLMSKALQAVGREMAPVVRLGVEQLVSTGAKAMAGAAFGYLTGGPMGAAYGGALGISSGALRLTNG